MAKKSYKVIIFSLFLLVIITACQQGKPQTGAPTSPFIGGTSGLVINFEKDAPPPEVTDGGSFPFNAIVRLVNEGEADVKKEDVIVGISGPPPRTFGVEDSSLVNQQPQDDLSPKTRGPDGKVIEGGTVFVTLPPTSGNPDKDYLKAVSFAGNTPFTFRADVCYKYKTRGSTKLCVLKDLLNVDQQDLCQPNGIRQVFSSGAPVQLANFRQSVAGQNRITFSFDIVHSGNGNIFQASRETAAGKDVPSCPRDSIRDLRAKQDRVKARISVEGLSGVQNEQDLRAVLTCNNIDQNGEVILISGKRTIICNLDLTGKHNADFESIVNMELDYNYDDNKETTVLVKHLPNIGP